MTFFAETTMDGATDVDVPPTPPAPLDAVVCGGGPAGLLSAIMLADTFDYRDLLLGLK